MGGRTIEDRLREEYFSLLPHARRVVEELETQVRYCLLPLSRMLERYERIVVTARVKECDSAVGGLRRRQEGSTFDPDRADAYSLTALKDLAGVRVMVFPRRRWMEANGLLRHRFPAWTSDPIPGYETAAPPAAFKYHGFCEASNVVRGELQVVPMLVGLFWQVEHSAIYKPAPQLKGVVDSPTMNQRANEVLKAIEAFEDEFERLVRRVRS